MPKTMSPELLDLVAGRFKALGDSARLRILNAMRQQERTVSDLVDMTGLSQANVSKHLSVLHGLGFVKRRKEGLFVYYALAGRDTFRLCDIMCGRIEAEMQARRRAVSSGRAAAK